MKKYRHTYFYLLCGILAALAVLLAGSNVAVIVFRGLKSLPDALCREETLFALRFSIKCACISTGVCFLLAIPTAYILTHVRIPFHSCIETALELTMALPNIVVGLSLLIMFSSPAGKYIKSMGFPVVFSPAGIIMAQIAVNLPFAIKLTLAAFKNVNRKLELVAGLLGATPFFQFTTILLPLSRNVLISALILVWSRALGEFGAALMLVGVTRMKTETLPAGIYLAVSTNNLDSALANAFILLAISAISLGVANYLTRTDRTGSRYV